MNYNNNYILPLRTGYYSITQGDIEHYQGLFPFVDVEQEIRSMVGWCEANPKKRKTERGVNRFITNWLIKASQHPRKKSFLEAAMELERELL